MNSWENKFMKSKYPKRNFSLALIFSFLAFAFLLQKNAGAQIFKVDIPQNELCLTGENTPFALDKVWDSVIFASAAATYGSALFKDHVSSKDKYDPSKIYDKDDINSLDRFFMTGYNNTLHNAGTVTCIIATAGIPAATFLTESACGNFSGQNLFDVAVMYSEAILFTNGIKDWIKIGARRERPYMYFDDRDQDGIDSNDFMYSFLSGHTANAFMGATFTSYVFCSYYPDSNLKIPVIATSYLFAAGTGAMRMASGNHFFTDVLAGAAMGSAVGFAVPFVHRFFAQRNNSQTGDSSKKPQLMFSPYGINVHMNF